MLKLQYFGHLMRGTDSLEKTLMLGKIEGRRRRRWRRMRWLDGIMGDSEGQGSLACCSPWGRKELDMTERPNNNFRAKLFPLPGRASSLSLPLKTSLIPKVTLRGWFLPCPSNPPSQSKTPSPATCSLCHKMMPSPPCPGGGLGTSPISLAGLMNKHCLTWP